MSDSTQTNGAPETATPAEALSKLNIQQQPAPAATSSVSNGSGGAASSAGGASTENAPLANASIYVGELNPDVSESVLYEIFSQIGQVVSIRICRDAVTQVSLGYAYVNYASPEDAKKAIQELNYARIQGRPCRIMWTQRDPAQRRNGKGNIYIKNLDPSIDNKTLHDTFSEFGEILSCKVVTDYNGRSLGFGFIHYAEASAAEEAIETVNGMVLNGMPVYVAHHIPKTQRESHAEQQRQNYTNVYVKNLDATEFDTNDKLKALFSPFGEITSALLTFDEQGKSRGFGFVNFADHGAAEKAVAELNGKEIAGLKLYAGRAQTRSERHLELKKQHEAKRTEYAAKTQGCNIYVKNLEDDIDDDKLRETFAPFGEITSARVMKDDEGRPRGFGFVNFTTPEEASRAIAEMTKHMLGSKPLYVALAQQKDFRRNQNRQQINAQNQLRFQQQAAAAAAAQGLPPFMGAPLMYGLPPGALPQLGQIPGQIPGQVPGGPRMYPGVQSQMMVPPRGFQQQGPQQGPPPPPPQGQPQSWKPGQGPALQQPPLEQLVAQMPTEEARRQVIGEVLYSKILALGGIDGEVAASVTGMLLDMDEKDLLALNDDPAALKEQVDQALSAYREYIQSTEQQ